MKTTLSFLALLAGAALSVTAEPESIPNRLIDFNKFTVVTDEAGEARKIRRLTEEQFISMAGEKNTIVLDTRSAAKFALLHVKGARHLNFSDITTETLAEVVPSKDTRILIYCNNNFTKAPRAFPSKKAEAALNIPTFITLYSYGYRNVYELGPLLDVKKTNIALEGAQFASLK